ncbi:MAG: DUF1631 family protein [Proteobacteria bacterium]|nr:DUF1631 family protein [Pseudomonadota bacterium]
MANNKSKNVVDINKGIKPSQTKIDLILQNTHKKFVRGLNPAINEFYEKLDDSLFDFAEKADSNDKQSLFFEAMREVRKKKDAMVKKFSANIQHVFKQFKQQNFDYFETASVYIEDDMSLVNEQELDQNLAVGNLITKSNTMFHQNLFALEKRFSSLIGHEKLKVNQIPISPFVTVKSFSDTLSNLNVEITVKLILLKLFERNLIAKLQNIYTEINQYLKENDICPTIKFRVPTQARNQSPQSNTPKPEQTVTDQLAASEAPLANKDTNFDYIMSALNNRHQGIVPQTQALDLSVITNALGLLQKEMLNNIHSSQSHHSPTEIKDEILKKIKSLDIEGSDKAVKQKDEDTIDLIGMLFQFLVDDRNLPDKIQILLAKLQIPYLHLALKDRNLFSNKDNNARKLLDQIAQSSIGWSEDNDKKGKFYDKIEGIVHFILKNHQHDIDFNAIIDDFEEFEARNKKRTKAIERRTSEKALGQDRILEAKQKTADIINNKIDGIELPKLVTDILLSSWANVLVLAHLRHSDDPAKIKTYTQFVDHIVHLSNKNKTKNASIEHINQVCERLSHGLKMVAFDEDNNKQKCIELQTLLIKINQIENNGELIKTKVRSNEIKDRIKKDLNANQTFPKQAEWIEKRQLKSFNLPTRVTFETDTKNNRTIMEVNTIDFPGVLSRISTAIDLCGTKLQGAKIATYGERVEDIFYLRNNENKAIDDPLKFECLENSILDALS